MSGSQNGRAKIKEEDVFSIRLRKKNGETVSEVQKDYEHILTRGSFNNIWYFQNWKNIIVQSCIDYPLCRGVR